MKQLNAFKWGADKQTTGVTLDGWREVRRLDPVQRVLQFEFYKTFYGYDVMDYVNTGWDAFTDAQSYQEIVGSHHVRLHHETLQQISPNIVIVRVAERIPGNIGDVHVVYLVFRVRTDHGFTQCMRSIWCPELLQAVQGPNDMVTVANLIWFHWDVLEGDEQGYTIRNGSIVGGLDVSYAHVWMAEAFASVVRCEHKATGRKFLISDM